MPLAEFPELVSGIAWTVRRWVTHAEVMSLFRKMVRQYVRDFRKRSDDYRKWRAEYDEHVGRVHNEERIRNQDAGTPELGWEWQEYSRHHRKPDGTFYGTDTAGWTPPHLLVKNSIEEPSHPLPFSDYPVERARETPLTRAAKYATLAAIHDSLCDEFEKINPYPDEGREGGPYRALRLYAETPTERGKEVLPVILDEVRKELKDSGLLPEASEPEIDSRTQPLNINQTTSQSVVVVQAVGQASPVDREVNGESGGQKEVPGNDGKRNRSAPASPAAEEHRIAKTADEAVEILGDEWATNKQLAHVTGKSESAIRGAVRRAKATSLWLENNVETIDQSRPGTPRFRFRIRGVWQFLSSDSERSQENLPPETTSSAT